MVRINKKTAFFDDPYEFDKALGSVDAQAKDIDDQA